MHFTSASAVAAKSFGALPDPLGAAPCKSGPDEAAGAHAPIAAQGERAGFSGVASAANAALFRELLATTACQAADAAVSNYFARIDQSLTLSDAAHSRAPATMIARLASALQSYGAAPGSQTAALAALEAAKDVADSLRNATAAIQNERRRADAGIGAAVKEINALLGQFADLNKEVVAASAAGAIVTGSMERRDRVLLQLSRKIGLTTIARAKNDMVVYTDSGVALFDMTPCILTFQETPNLSAGDCGGAVHVDGVRITGTRAALPLRSGALAALTRIRDEIAPQLQRRLDQIARRLIVRFARSHAGAQTSDGLFTHAGAAQNAAGATDGLAGRIEVDAHAEGGVLALLQDDGKTSGAARYAQTLIELARIHIEGDDSRMREAPPATAGADLFAARTDYRPSAKLLETVASLFAALFTNGAQ